MPSSTEFFVNCIKRIFSQTALVQITQTYGWKKGKTDFSLKIAEILDWLDLIKLRNMATNIFTYDTIPLRADLISLSDWLNENNEDKLYIFDEVNEHLSNRRFMSKKSYGASLLFPQLSKRHARMIIIAQDFSKADPDLSSSSWIRGIFTKLTKTDIELESNFLDIRHVFHNITKTRIPFDPFRVATFTERPLVNEKLQDEDLDKFRRRLEGEKCKQLGFKNSMEYNRWQLKIDRRLFNSYVEHNPESLKLKEEKEITT